MGGFAENLKSLRSQKGCRQEANALGISKQAFTIVQDESKIADSV